jgi:hypothetical protein
MKPSLNDQVAEESAAVCQPLEQPFSGGLNHRKLPFLL